MRFILVVLYFVHSIKMNFTPEPVDVLLGETTSVVLVLLVDVSVGYLRHNGVLVNVLDPSKPVYDFDAEEEMNRFM